MSLDDVGGDEQKTCSTELLVKICQRSGVADGHFNMKLRESDRMRINLSNGPVGSILQNVSAICLQSMPNPSNHRRREINFQSSEHGRVPYKPWKRLSFAAPIGWQSKRGVSVCPDSGSMKIPLYQLIGGEEKCFRTRIEYRGYLIKQHSQPLAHWHIAEISPHYLGTNDHTQHRKASTIFIRKV